MKHTYKIYATGYSLNHLGKRAFIQDVNRYFISNDPIIDAKKLIRILSAHMSISLYRVYDKDGYQIYSHDFKVSPKKVYR